MYGTEKFQSAGMALGAVAAMDRENVPTKARESDTSRELELLEKEIEGLNSALGYTKDRIEPILRPAMPQPGLSGTNAPERVIAPMANHLQGLRRRVSAMREGIIAINDRIDI